LEHARITGVRDRRDHELLSVRTDSREGPVHAGAHVDDAVAPRDRGVLKHVSANHRTRWCDTHSREIAPPVPGMNARQRSRSLRSSRSCGVHDAAAVRQPRRDQILAGVIMSVRGIPADEWPVGAIIHQDETALACSQGNEHDGYGDRESQWSPHHGVRQCIDALRERHGPVLAGTLLTANPTEDLPCWLCDAAGGVATADAPAVASRPNRHVAVSTARAADADDGSRRVGPARPVYWQAARD